MLLNQLIPLSTVPFYSTFCGHFQTLNSKSEKEQKRLDPAAFMHSCALLWPSSNSDQKEKVVKLCYNLLLVLLVSLNFISDTCLCHMAIALSIILHVVSALFHPFHNWGLTGHWLFYMYAINMFQRR